MLELDLSGQVAVIAGGSEGVGRATAAELAEEDIEWRSAPGVPMSSRRRPQR